MTLPVVVRLRARRYGYGAGRRGRRPLRSVGLNYVAMFIVMDLRVNPAATRLIDFNP